MHENEDNLTGLQTLLDTTYARAGAHLRSIHTPQRRLSAQQVCDVLRGVCVLNLATLDKGGAPVVAPVDGLFFGGCFWFGSAQDSQRFNNIRRDNRVSAAFTVGEEISIVVHGAAHEIDTSEARHEPIHEYCLEVYGPEFDSWGNWGKNPYAWIEAQRFYAMQVSEQDL